MSLQVRKVEANVVIKIHDKINDLLFEFTENEVDLMATYLLPEPLKNTLDKKTMSEMIKYLSKYTHLDIQKIRKSSTVNKYASFFN